MKIHSRKNVLLAAVAAAFMLGGSPAFADLHSPLPELGDLTKWGVFTLGADGLQFDKMSGHTYISGDVGVAGNGNIELSAYATIHGNLNYHTGGTLKMGKKTQIDGAITQNDADLDNSVNEATTASAHASTFVTSAAYAGINNISLKDHQRVTLFATNDRPGNTTVLNLGNLTLSGNAVLTLSGSSSSNFIINVSSEFKLTSHSEIRLDGGLTWNNVLFNVIGAGTDSKKKVELSGDSRMAGVLMAVNRTVQMSGHSVVVGEVVANRLKLSGDAEVFHPSVVSP